VVHVWADADNQSLGFTARTADGRPADLEWGSEGATSSTDGTLRTLTYRLRSTSTELVLGHFLLGSMRVERDFQYAQAHLRPSGRSARRTCRRSYARSWNKSSGSSPPSETRTSRC